MSESRSVEIANFFADHMHTAPVGGQLRGLFLSQFPDPTVEEWYAGYELAHEIASSRIDDLFSAILDPVEEDVMLASLVLSAA